MMHNQDEADGEYVVSDFTIGSIVRVKRSNNIPEFVGVIYKIYSCNVIAKIITKFCIPEEYRAIYEVFDVPVECITAHLDVTAELRENMAELLQNFTKESHNG